MKKILLLLCGMVLISLPLMAQIDLPKPNFSVMQSKPAGFFDPSRLKMSHSLGFETMLSSHGGSYLSRYTNHLNYRLNPKLDLKLDLSVINYGSSSPSFKLNDDNRSRIIPSFSVDYRPTDSIKLEFRYQQAAPLWTVEQPWYERTRP